MRLWPKGRAASRAVADGYQQRRGGRVGHKVRLFALGVVPGAASCEVGLQRGRAVVGVPLQNGVALGQQTGHIVDDPGGVAAVQHRHAGKAVFTGADVQERTARDKGRKDSAVEKDVGIVLEIDAVQVEVVLPELPENEPIGQRIHSLAAPAQHLAEGAELGRCDHAEVLHGILHLIVFIAGKHPAALQLQLAAEIGHAAGLAHGGFLLFVRKYSQ